MKIITTLAVAGLMASGATGIAAAAVAAQEAGAHAFAAIDLHDINLQTRAGEEVLKRRLKDSVKQQCRAFSNHAAGGFAGPNNGRVVSTPIVESPRSKCVRQAAREARVYREALLERAGRRN